MFLCLYSSAFTLNLGYIYATFLKDQQVKWRQKGTYKNKKRDVF